MAVKKLIFIILLIIGIAFTFSCKKNTEQDIIGTWNRMILDSSISHIKEEVWEFTGSSIKITRTLTPPGSEPFVSDSGSYIVKAGITKKYIRTTGFQFAWYNNLDWSIERLKAGQLVIFSDRDHYFLYYEFVKKY